MKSKFLVAFSDPHVGASSGLLSPNFINFEGNAIKQNPYQKWTWKCWVDAWKWMEKVTRGEPYVAVGNGDLIDGNHHGTREIISPDVYDHYLACVEILAQFVKTSEEFYITEGTNVHTQNTEHGIASSLKSMGVNVVSPNNRKSAWPELDITIHGCRIAIDHHVSTALSSLSESAAYSRTIADVTNKRQRAGWKVPKVIIRSHRHQFGVFDDGYKQMVVLPPWQGLGRFSRRVATGAVPQCGMVILDWSNSPYAGLPTIHRRIYTPDQSPSYL